MKRLVTTPQHRELNSCNFALRHHSQLPTCDHSIFFFPTQSFTCGEVVVDASARLIIRHIDCASWSALPAAATYFVDYNSFCQFLVL